jgi:hypothetical protein
MHLPIKVKSPNNISKWQMEFNSVFNGLMEGADIVRFIKEQRIKWLGHIQRMGQARPNRRLLDWKTMKTRPLVPETCRGASM